MTLPSTPHLPSPAGSRPPPPSGQSVHPGPACANAPTRKRGGQPGNQNARKTGTYSTCHPGLFSSTLSLVQLLRVQLKDPASSLGQIVEQARTARQALPPPVQALDDGCLPALRLFQTLTKMITRAYSYYIPSRRLSDALSAIAQDPLGYFKLTCKDFSISRDADSFFPVSEKSVRYSTLPPPSRGGNRGASPKRSVGGKPPSAVSATSRSIPVGRGAEGLATNLTDAQWAVLAPLLPPDPHLDWLTGEPPVIIAANRWGFTRYYFTGEFNDFVIMKNYHQILQRCPGLATPLQAGSPAKKRGRPRTSPHLLLDAIFWKLATGQPWHALPHGFPPVRRCQNYYRRLFLSGRLYTLLLALYNHLRLEASTDLSSLLEAGVFTTTPAQKIALRPDAPSTWQNYTALLFMQLARSAYSRLERNYKEANPLYILLPDFKGTASLSTGMIPSLESQEPTPVFQPLEDSPAWKKWQKIERDQKKLAREVSKRLRSPDPPASDDSISSFLDEGLEP